MSLKLSPAQWKKVWLMESTCGIWNANLAMKDNWLKNNRLLMLHGILKTDLFKNPCNINNLLSFNQLSFIARVAFHMSHVLSISQTFCYCAEDKFKDIYAQKSTLKGFIKCTTSFFWWFRAQICYLRKFTFCP